VLVALIAGTKDDAVVSEAFLACVAMLMGSDPEVIPLPELDVLVADMHAGVWNLGWGEVAVAAGGGLGLKQHCWVHGHTVPWKHGGENLPFPPPPFPLPLPQQIQREFYRALCHPQPHGNFFKTLNLRLRASAALWTQRSLGAAAPTHVGHTSCRAELRMIQLLCEGTNAGNNPPMRGGALKNKAALGF
jgi:hypothetical protein